MNPVREFPLTDEILTSFALEIGTDLAGYRNQKRAGDLSRSRLSLDADAAFDASVPAHATAAATHVSLVKVPASNTY